MAENRREYKNEVQQLRAIMGEQFVEKSKVFFDNYSKLMAYYRCAIMEIETKFNVLNEEFSLRYDRNPINSIKSRLKSPMSIKDKLEKKQLPFSTEAIEKKPLRYCGGAGGMLLPRGCLYAGRSASETG